MDQNWELKQGLTWCKYISTIHRFIIYQLSTYYNSMTYSVSSELIVYLIVIANCMALPLCVTSNFPIHSLSSSYFIPSTLHIQPPLRIPVTPPLVHALCLPLSLPPSWPIDISVLTRWRHAWDVWFVISRSPFRHPCGLLRYWFIKDVVVCKTSMIAAHIKASYAGNIVLL